MKVQITIKTDNAAFYGSNWGPEVKRILADLAESLAHSLPEERNFTLRDINGNWVGTCKVQD